MVPLAEVATAAAQAVGTFAVTNIDDLVVLALLFGRARAEPGASRRVWVGQYTGFVAILVLAIAASAGLRLLDDGALAYLGLVPLALGVAAGVEAWRHRGDEDEDRSPRALTVAQVAAITVANGGDNLGVYVPVFTATDTAGVVVHGAVYLTLVAVWCAAGQWLATRPATARALDRWGDVVVPVVFVAIGVSILVDGGAFGL